MARTFKQINRTVHTSDSGIEIVRTFYLDPYEDHPAVLKELQGSVTSEGEGKAKTWTRHPPAQDPWIKTCYCNEARVMFPESDVFATATKLADQDALDTKETFPPGVAGCHIEAHYRPLISAFDAEHEGADESKTEIWDWLDPTITPGVRQIPWPDGLFVGTQVPFFGRVPDSVPQEVGTPIEVPVSNVSIRRILVGQPPWDAMKLAANALNKDVWPTPNSPMSEGLPRFEPKTLRFGKVIVQNMIDSKGTRWYELTYNFDWIHHYSDDVFDTDGNGAPGWVTWNHVFMRPWWVAQTGVGWYEVFRGIALRPFNVRMPVDIPGLDGQLFGGSLHNAVDFDTLFKLDP